MILHEKTRSRRYSREVKIDAEYADDLALLANRHN